MTDPDFSTAIGKVRAYIPDVEQIPNPSHPEAEAEYIFADAHLQVFLDNNNGNIRLAAADACEALGTSEAIIGKVLNTEDLKSDAAKLMGQYLARARQLRTAAQTLDPDDSVDGFDIVPYWLPGGRPWPEATTPWR